MIWNQLLLFFKVIYINFKFSCNIFFKFNLVVFANVLGFRINQNKKLSFYVHKELP